MSHRVTHHKLGLYHLKRHKNNKLKIGRYSVPNLAENQSLPLSVLFLGPHADNHALLSELADEAMNSIVKFRTQIWKNPKIHKEADHHLAVAELKHRFKQLLEYLQEHSTPFSSLNYLAHMTGDQLVPALAAYYAGMIYNSNNVSIQGSTATTLLEMLAMRDLCDMVGFTRLALFHGQNTETPQHIAYPWAHITCDGSIANIEGMWSAREAKILPFAVLNALQNEPCLEKGRDITVTTCDGKNIRLLDADTWELWNLTRNERLAIPFRLAHLTGLKSYEIWAVLTRYDINTQGWHFYSQYFINNQSPIILVPSTIHYSAPKAAAVLGLGTKHLCYVKVDKFGRMKMEDLRRQLDNAQHNKQPVLMVLSVFGSTEESAVDPLSDILTIRKTYRQQGLDFDVHVDAAWGGYFISAIRKEFNMEDVQHAQDEEVLAQVEEVDPFLEDTSQVLLSDYVIRQAKDIRFADSVTIDPHKMGYVQYPAGSILYTNGDVINLTTFTGSYIGSAAEPSVGLFGLEGSRPGAAAAAVYFTHACLRPDYKGYGEVISRSLFNAKQFYAELMCMGHQEKFKTTLLMPYDAAILPVVQNKILRKSLTDIRNDSAALQVFRELGPDQNIVDYGFNPVYQGKVNTDVQQYNKFISQVYQALHIQYHADASSDDARRSQPDLMVSMTTFKLADYGEEFMLNFAGLLGLEMTETIPQELNCLRSTVMSPFTAEVEGGSYWPTLIRILGDTVAKLVNEKSD